MSLGNWTSVGLVVLLACVGLSGRAYAGELEGCKNLENMLAINLPDEALVAAIQETRHRFTAPEIECVEGLGVSESVMAVVRSMEESPEAAARRVAEEQKAEREKAIESARAEAERVRDEARAEKEARSASIRSQFDGDTYEDAVRRHAYISKQAKSVSAGKWKIETSMAPMDDTTTVVLSLSAENAVGGWLSDARRPELVLRCREREFNVFVMTGLTANPGANYQKAAVRIRLGRDPAQSLEASESTSWDSLFLPRPHSLTTRMRNAERLLFEFTPFHSNPVMATFDLKGLEDAIRPLELACNVAGVNTAIQ